MWWIQSNPPAPAAYPLTSTSGSSTSKSQCTPPADPWNPSPLSLGPSVLPGPEPRPRHDPRMLRPTGGLTGPQLCYILVIQGMGTMGVAGLINFLIGYALYATPRPPPGPPPQGSIPPFLFRPPVSLAADAAFTTLLQCQLTWLISLWLVNWDLSRGKVAPFDPVFNSNTDAGAGNNNNFGGGVARRGRGIRGKLRRFWRWVWTSSRFARWFMCLGHYNAERGSLLCGKLFCCGGGRKDRNGGGGGGGGGGGFGGIAGCTMFLLAQMGRAVLVAVAALAILLPPTLAALAATGRPFEGDFVFLGRWDGVAFKTVYSMALGMLTAPVLALMWIARAGYIVRARSPGAV